MFYFDLSELCPAETTQIELNYNALDEGLSISPESAADALDDSGSMFSLDASTVILTVTFIPVTDISFILLSVTNIRLIKYEINLQNKIIITPEDVSTYMIYSNIAKHFIIKSIILLHLFYPTQCLQILANMPIV